MIMARGHCTAASRTAAAPVLVVWVGVVLLLEDLLVSEGVPVVKGLVTLVLFPLCLVVAGVVVGAPLE